MKTINLKLVGISAKFSPVVLIDDKPVSLKKNNFDAYEGSVQTEKDEVSLQIFRNLELSSKWWWLYAIISFIISIFGIFEPLYDKKCIALNCAYSLKLSEKNDLTIRFHPIKDQTKAVDVETSCEISELANLYVADKKAKKRWLWQLLTKIAIWIVIIILVVYFVATNIN